MPPFKETAQVLVGIARTRCELRPPPVMGVLPLLYLHCLSSGDFREALPALLGPTPPLRVETAS